MRLIHALRLSVAATIAVQPSASFEPARFVDGRRLISGAIATASPDCQPWSDAPGRALTESRILTLAGRFRLTVVGGTSGEVTKRVSVGTLHLWVPDSAHRYISEYEFPLVGTASIDLGNMGFPDFDTPLSSRAPDPPGVQINASGGMVFGAPIYRTDHPALVYTEDGKVAPDSIQRLFPDRDIVVPGEGGARFAIREITPTGFRGTWYDGRPVVPAISGYFCARRIR